MRSRSALRHVLFVLLVIAAIGTAPAAGQGKPPLDHSVYEQWRGIGETTLARDGGWVAYQITYQNDDAELVVRSTSGDTEYRIPRGGNAAFTASASHVVALIEPPMQEARQARLDDLPAAERPTPQLGILSLADGSLRSIDRVRSFRVPEEGGQWVAFLHEPELEAEDSAEDSDEPEAEEPAAEPDAVAKALEDRKPGTRLVLLDLASGAEHEFANVTDYAAAIDGGRLAIAAASADGTGDGVWLIDPADGGAADTES